MRVAVEVAPLPVRAAAAVGRVALDAEDPALPEPVLKDRGAVRRHPAAVDQRPPDTAVARGEEGVVAEVAAGRGRVAASDLGNLPPAGGVRLVVVQPHDIAVVRRASLYSVRAVVQPGLGETQAIG